MSQMSGLVKVRDSPSPDADKFAGDSSTEEEADERDTDSLRGEQDPTATSSQDPEVWHS